MPLRRIGGGRDRSRSPRREPPKPPSCGWVFIPPPPPLPPALEYLRDGDTCDGGTCAGRDGITAAHRFQSVTGKTILVLLRFASAQDRMGVPPAAGLFGDAASAAAELAGSGAAACPQGRGETEQSLSYTNNILTRMKCRFDLSFVQK